MRRLFSDLRFVAALLLGIVVAAQAQFNSFPPGVFSNKAALDPAAGGAAPTWTAQTSVANPACGFLTTCSIGSVTVPTGFIVAGAYVNNQGGAAGTITAVSVCGTGLTLQASTTGTAQVIAALFYGSVTGGTCTVQITYSQAGAIADAAVALGLLSNLSSTTPGTGCKGDYAGSQAAPYPCTAGITVASGGFGIGVFGYSNATTMTSANLTIDSQANAGTGANATSFGIGNTTTSNTPQFGGVGFAQAAIVAAPWR